MKLKGNYKLKNDHPEKTALKAEKTVTQEFERRALEKLGGSIAFVQKKNTFMWDGGKEGGK